jgi:hypothetical protein
MAKPTLTCTLPDGTKDKRQTARPYTHVVAGRKTPKTFTAEANTWRTRYSDALASIEDYKGLAAGTIEPNLRPASLYGGTPRAADLRFHVQCMAEGSYLQWAKEAEERLPSYLKEAEGCELLASAGTYGKWSAVSWHSSERLCKFESWMQDSGYELEIIEVDA